MPYIKQDRRARLDPLIEELQARIRTPGELNYVISRLLTLLTAEGVPIENELYVTYDSLSRWRAAVIDASTEFYYRVMGPYEHTKMRENGDVYDEILDKIYPAPFTPKELEPSPGLYEHCAVCGKTWGEHFGRGCDHPESERRFRRMPFVVPDDAA